MLKYLMYFFDDNQVLLSQFLRGAIQVFKSLYDLGINNIFFIKNIVNQETSLAMEKNYRIIVEYLKRNKINEKNIIGLTKFFPGDKVSLKSGIWEYYDEQGRLQTRVLFKNGKKVKIFK